MRYAQKDPRPLRGSPYVLLGMLFLVLALCKLLGSALQDFVALLPAGLAGLLGILFPAGALFILLRLAGSGSLRLKISIAIRGQKARVSESAGNRLKGKPAPIDAISNRRVLHSLAPAGRILVVESEKKSRLMMEQALIELGHRVTTACFAWQALELFKKAREPFTLAILDVELPDENGVKLAETFMALRPGQRILLCTSMSSGRTPWESIQKSGYRLLLKPCTKTGLLRAVNEAAGTGA